MTLTNQEVDYGWQMYQNAAASSLKMLVLGDISLRTNKALLQNLGVTAVTTSPQTRQLVSSKSANLLETGAVLNEQYWWPFFNDCWVMGWFMVSASSTSQVLIGHSTKNSGTIDLNALRC